MPGKQRKRQGTSDSSRSPRRNQRKSAMRRSDTRATAGSAAGAVGSDPRAVRSVGGKGDFGVPETGRERERAYVSQETKSQDPGALPGHSNGEGTRTSGVGGNDSGVGSSSGGDVDTDIIGLGAGGATVSQSGPDDRRDGKDMLTGEAAGLGTNSRRTNRPAPNDSTPPGAFVQRSDGDASTTGDGQGAASVTNPHARDDDSFAGELSMDDASGADNTRADRL